MPRPVPARRRRDRRGRAARGPLVWAQLSARTLGLPHVPLGRTRAEQFDDIVLDAVEHLEQRWSDELAGVEFAVEDVPNDLTTDHDDTTYDDTGGAPVPLARLIPGGQSGGSTPPRIVIYRRPLLARAADPADLADLVLDVVVAEVARMLGLEPEAVDPDIDRGEQ